MGVINHILNGLILQVSRIHTAGIVTVWDRITTVWIVELNSILWRIQRVWTSWRRHLQWKRVLLWCLHMFRFSGQHGSWWQHTLEKKWASNMGFEVPWCFAKQQSKRWASAHFLAFDAAMWFGGFCQLCAWLRRFARCSLRERDSWFLSGSPRLVFSAQLCRFGRVDVIWLCRVSVVFLAWIVKYMVLMFSNQDKRLVGF